MKIAIIGTHSTGKTTILNAVAHELTRQGKTVIILPEYARLCPFPIHEQTTLTAQMWIQHQQREQEKKYDSPDVILLCDRASIDNLAYLERVSGDQDISRVKRAAIAHTKTYTHIFKTHKLPLEAEADGVRATDKAFRDEIDIRITSLLDTYAIEHIPLPQTDDTAVHVQHILSYVSI
jgi:nicotinamide riboside kinase